MTKKIVGKDYTYTGEVDSEGNFEGQGIIEWKNGNIYKGYFSEGTMSGLGIFSWPSGDQYVGNFKEGQRHGRGRYTWSDGSYYEGDHIKGDFTGNGIRRFDDGNFYLGEWLNDEQHGRGIIIEEDAYCAECEFENDLLINISKIYDQDERLDLAQSLEKSVPPNYEAIIALYDPEEDENHRGWIIYMGYILNQHLNNPYFDADAAFTFFIKGAELDYPSSLFNIAAKYFNGAETEINIELAQQYYVAASERGHFRAGAWIYEIAKRYDERLFDPDHKDYTSEIIDYLEQSRKSGSFEASEIATGLVASGRWYERDIDFVIREYQWALENNNAQPSEVSARSKMIWRLALRTYLGLGVQEDKEKALEILSAIPDKSNDPYVRERLKQNIQKLNKIISREVEQPKFYNATKRTVRGFYETELNPESEVVSYIEEGESIGSITSLVDVEWCVKELAEGEKWKNYNQWKLGLEGLQAEKMGLWYNDIVKSTFFAGPTYNPIADNGLPVLGVLAPASPDKATVEHQIISHGAYVPEAGVVKLKGLVCNKDGTLTFDFVKASDSPALLVAEDFEVAMLLAYGHPDKVITPSLSLESPSEHGFNDEYDSFKHKLWSPPWLGYTDFGRTLYMTDQLIGDICWHPEEFEVGSPDRTFHPDVPDFALGLAQDIRLTGGRSGAGSSARVMLKPEHISLQDRKDRKGNIFIKINEIKMRVDGSYIVDQGTDGENRLVALNDNMYQQGRTVNKLTERYNDIASLMPIFARAQELMALMHAVRHARETIKFVLNPDLQDRITQRYRGFEALPPLPKSELLCVDLPLNYRRA